MIAFNGQYLPAASHGNMRITAACLGGQWVIAPWLKTATQQAIIAAFGAEEGIAVISRTNDYLNALALTDPTRAQQLAMFIQEDPLLVTSLVETSKTRWLVASSAYINTQYYPTKGDVFSFSFRIDNLPSTGYNRVCPFGCNNKCWLRVERENFIEYAMDAQSNLNTVDFKANTAYAFNIDTFNKVVVIGENTYKPTSALTTTTTNPMLLYKGGGTYSSNNYQKYLDGFIVSNNSEKILHLCPFLRNGENGMLDIISGTFYPNANTQGSFTIAITDNNHSYKEEGQT